MKKVFWLIPLLLLALSLGAIASVNWLVPSSVTEGRLTIPPEISGEGTLMATAGNLPVKTWVESSLPGEKMNFGVWQIPVTAIYRPPTLYKGRCNIHLKEAGDYRLSIVPGVAIGSSSVAEWWLSYDVWPPLFGVPRYSQVDNGHPYANGSKTIEQKGCLMCSMLAIAEHIAGVCKTPESFNAELVANGGFGGTNGRDIISSIAADLLGLVYYGEFKYEAQNIQKYMARGWGLAGKVAVPHRRRDGSRFTTEHWVAVGDGVIIKPFSYEIGIMDPAERATIMENSNYAPKRLKVFAPRYYQSALPYYLTRPNWWLDRGYFRSGVSGTSSLSALSSSLSFTENENSDSLMTPLSSQIEAWTDSGVMIEKVITSSFVLNKDNSGMIEVCESVTLVDCSDSELHDDTDEVDPEGIVEIVPVRSEVNILPAQKDTYTFELKGEPNASYKLTVLLRSDTGKETRVFTGTLDLSGRKAISLDFDPGTIVLKLGGIRKLASGSKVIFGKNISYKDSEHGEYFCQDEDRSCGIRVLSANPTISDNFVNVRGRLIQIAPEIVVWAEEEEFSSAGEISPIGMPKFDWPQMANCLLAKVWGKVVAVDDSTVTVSDGLIELTLEQVSSPVNVGDILIADTVLRDDRQMAAITCQIVN